MFKNIIEINPLINSHDTDKYLVIHFDLKTDRGIEVENRNGHVYVELVNNKRSHFFGKNPAPDAVFSGMNYGVILKKDEAQRESDAYKYFDKTKEQIIISKSIPLTDQGYKAALQRAEAAVESPATYVVVGANCIDFAQEVYHAAGLPGVFTESFTLAEMKSLNSWAGLYMSSMPNMESARYVTGDSREEVAERLNLPLERVVLVGAHFMDHDDISQKFMITPQETQVQTVAREFKQDYFNLAKATQIMLAPIKAKLDSGDRLALEELDYGSLIAMNYLSEMGIAFEDAMFSLGKQCSVAHIYLACMDTDARVSRGVASSVSQEEIDHMKADSLAKSMQHAAVPDFLVPRPDDLAEGMQVAREMLSQKPRDEEAHQSTDNVLNDIMQNALPPSFDMRGLMPQADMMQQAMGAAMGIFGNMGNNPYLNPNFTQNLADSITRQTQAPEYKDRVQQMFSGQRAGADMLEERFAAMNFTALQTPTTNTQQDDAGSNASEILDQVLADLERREEMQELDDILAGVLNNNDGGL